MAKWPPLRDLLAISGTFLAISADLGSLGQSWKSWPFFSRGLSRFSHLLACCFTNTKYSVHEGSSLHVAYAAYPRLFYSSPFRLPVFTKLPERLIRIKFMDTTLASSIAKLRNRGIVIAYHGVLSVASKSSRYRPHGLFDEACKHRWLMIYGSVCMHLAARDKPRSQIISNTRRSQGTAKATPIR